ncbi:hypothetical protein FHG89_00660 [Micromonospora orduensis]|uniref:Uncharacterized protein n=1 Tax=Micromonospora orduensis TaxID=1420891 RepID=A0A5C4R043_9ACTN|nr:hypothetical protein [Micromonospora orduensis]TNH31739.1 hypothetical protein FHG89_00660 [Micromonospora orduensis]
MGVAGLRLMRLRYCLPAAALGAAVGADPAHADPLPLPTSPPPARAATSPTILTTPLAVPLPLPSAVPLRPAVPLPPTTALVPTSVKPPIAVPTRPRARPARSSPAAPVPPGLSLIHI